MDLVGRLPSISRRLDNVRLAGDAVRAAVNQETSHKPGT